MRRSRACDVGFLVAVLFFAWLGLRGRFDEVAAALRETTLAGVAAGLLAVLVGLYATGRLWLRLMAGLGGSLPMVDGLAVFYLGQLGKYIPGSVWSVGAQAQLARRHHVPAGVTVAAGMLFLGYHVVTAVLLGSLMLLTGALDPPWPDWASWVALAAAVLAVLPRVARWAGRRISGREVRLGLADTVVVAWLMAVAWSAYSVALVLLSPGQPWDEVFALGGAFAAAYVAGVVVVLAPAGLGAREVALVLLLTPVVGVGAATGLALLARVLHTAADALMAAGWWLAARGRVSGDAGSR